MIDIRDGTCTLCQPPEISESRPKLIEYQYEAVHPERWQPAALTHELDPTCGVDLLPRKPVGKKIRVAQTSRATPPPRRHPRWPLTAKPETRAVLRESGWHGSRKQARMAAKKTAAKKTAAKKTSTSPKPAKKAAAAKRPAATKAPAKKKTAKKASAKKNSLVNNINKRKRAGTSRPKSRSTVSKKSYKKMEEGWPDKK